MTTLENSRILVTGAAGFLGSHIVPMLIAQRAKVTGIDLRKALSKGNLNDVKSRMQLLEVDITDKGRLERMDFAFDYVIHLAAVAAPAQCELDPQKAFLTNVQGTFNVLKFATRNHVKKFIFSSTAHVYGISPKYMPTDERHPLSLHDTYTTTKIMGESLCRLFYDNYGMEYLTVRLFNSYGPRQSTDYFIPAMIAKARAGRIQLKDRHVTKDFIYVTDAVDAYVKALTSGYVGEVNIGSGVQTSLESVARSIAEAFKVELIFSDEARGGPTQMQSDISRANRVLGWMPKTPLGAGLAKTIDALRKEISR